MSDCLFCKIGSKEIEAEVVHESSEVIAFVDIAPVAPVHVLVIPRRHIGSAADLGEADGDLLVQLFMTISALAASAGLENGYRVVTNVGRDGGQTVDHLHLHLLGGRSFAWPPG